MESDEHARGIADTVARRSYGKLVAFLVARTRDVAAAEDALSDAFAVALTDWPAHGCPSNPEAWLLTVARRKLIDTQRRRQTSAAVVVQLQVLADAMAAAATQPDSDSALIDQRLGLLFTCAHPAIETSIRAPLMLQVVLGLDATMIASAFLVSPQAMSKRLVRAKSKIQQAGIPCVIPECEELPARLEAVLDAIYATFTAGWSDASGTDAMRRDLAHEAIFLAKLVAELLPREPEALGLLALVLYAHARRAARRDQHADYVPLADQDPSSWDAAMIAEAEAVLRHAGTLGSIGRYQLEAALQSAHVHGRGSGQVDWPAIVQLYDALLTLTHSPVVAINRALAIAELYGPDAARDALLSIDADPRLTEYQPYWAARAELLSKTGAYPQAWQAYELAIGLEREPAVRRFLQRRQASLALRSPTPPNSGDEP